MSGTELFIYYRIRETRAAEALSVVGEMHARLRSDFPQLLSRVLRRPAPDDNGLQTWMETYTTDGGVSDELRSIIEAHAKALRPLIEGERHTEAFVECAW
jgi:hypothetical protein